MARGRPLLIGLLIWALLMIVPDLARVVRPLSSFGFYADNNGMVYDTTGPFADKTASPAWIQDPSPDRGLSGRHAWRRRHHAEMGVSE